MRTADTMPHAMTQAELDQTLGHPGWRNSLRLCRLREDKNFRWC